MIDVLETDRRAVDSYGAAPIIGPHYVKFRNMVRYRVCDLQAWLDEHTVTPGPQAAQTK